MRIVISAVRKSYIENVDLDDYEDYEDEPVEFFRQHNGI